MWMSRTEEVRGEEVIITEDRLRLIGKGFMRKMGRRVIYLLQRLSLLHVVETWRLCHHALIAWIDELGTKMG